MDELKAAIEKNIELISSMTSLLYQKNVEEAYSGMPELLDSIMYISREGISNNLINESDAKEIAGILGNAMHAMENNDSILLADILQYDMVDFLNACKDKMI